MYDFIATEMQNMRVCSYCKKTQSCEQSAQKEANGNIKLCPDCYFEI